MEIFRLGLKFFQSEDSNFELGELIPIFHSWIQKQRLPGHLLIDVHDYSHVFHGPGILLVAHQGNLSLDQAGGQPGLLYYRKQPPVGSSDPLAAVFRTTLQACRLLEEEPALKGRLRFETGRFLLLANDRLLAPHTDETRRSMEPRLAEFLGRIYQGSGFQMSRGPDPKERFSVQVAAASLQIPDFLSRLG